MVFSSTLFIFVFLPMVIGIYFICPVSYRNALLLIFSLIFYGWGEPKYILVMIFSILINYFSGILIDRFRCKNQHKRCKIVLVVSLICNISILGYFKYWDFIIENINSMLGSSINILELALPIGISFYTFQTMSYVIDVYKENVKVQRNLINFGTYVTLFPQLIAGPIVRYITIEEQLGDRKETSELVAEGIRRFIIGLGKKVLLANQIGLLWSEIQDMSIDNMSLVTAWLGAIAFTFQIYFDFSGYSDMAIGLGKVLGFNFDENFNYPYMSRSITEFWRRWHISLGTWFREYVYIPLGGNKKGMFRQIINLLIVWGLTGLWHGASWNFITWGLYFGIILIIEKVFMLKWLNKLPKIISSIYAKILIILGWVIFGITDYGKMGEYIKVMLGNGISIIDTQAKYFLSTNIILIAILILASTDYPKKWGKAILSLCEGKEIVYLFIKNLFFIMVFILSIAFLVSDTYNPFLYFRF